MLSQTYSRPSIASLPPGEIGTAEASPRRALPTHPRHGAQSAHAWAAFAVVIAGGWATWTLANALLASWRFY